MISHKNYHIFITPIKNPWSEVSNGILGDVWVQKLTPNQPISDRDIAIAIAASVFSASLTKIYSAISPPCLVLKPYYQFVHGLNSLFKWFQHWLWSADGNVSWRHNTMSNWRRDGWIGGGYFHLLRAPFDGAVAKKHCPHALSWSSVVAGAAQAPYWLLPLQQWQRVQCNALMMHRTLNSLIGTINDNKF